MKQKGFALNYLIIGLVVLALAGGTYYLGVKGTLLPKTANTPKACTEEAKICPDGSSVGRTGPNCEFSPCPSGTSSKSSDETANWKIYSNTKYGFEVRYPEQYGQHLSDVDNVILFVSQKNDQVWDIRIAWYIQNTNKKSIHELGNLKNSEYIKMGSSDAIKLLPTNPTSLQVGYIFLHNGKEYNVEVTARNKRAMGDANQILSTFKFASP